MIRYCFGLVAAGLMLSTAMPVKSWAGKQNDTLVWATDKDVDTLDPYYNNTRETVIIGRLIFDSLLARDESTGQFKPLLAKTYKWIDPLTLDFELRDDVVFHDGKRFGPEDVVYTYSFAIDKKNHILLGSYVNWIKSVEQTGDHSVRFHLVEPFAAALEYLSGPTPIVPKGHYDGAGDDIRARASLPPVGTGPYRLKQFKTGDGFLLERNKNYFSGGPKGAPIINTLKFRTIKDPDSQVAELLTGGVDWIWDISKDKAEMLRSQKSVSVVEAPTMRVSFLSFDAVKREAPNPFLDARVRQAVAYAIDRKALATSLVGAAAPVIDAACYPSQFGCTQDVKRYEYDPAKARKLLSEAGYPDGFTTDIYAYRERNFTEAVIGDLRKVGIRANLKWLQYKALRQKMWDGNVQFAHLTWASFSIYDASAFTGYFFKGGPDDMAQDRSLQALLARADGVTDEEARKGLYKQALRIIADQAYVVPLFAYTKFYAFSSKLDFKPSDDEIPRFYNAFWK